MKSGDIILIPFPFAELTNKKVRPAVVIGLTKDKHKDIIVSAISSVVPVRISCAVRFPNLTVLQPSKRLFHSNNDLHTPSPQDNGLQA